MLSRSTVVRLALVLGAVLIFSALNADCMPYASSGPIVVPDPAPRYVMDQAFLSGGPVMPPIPLDSTSSGRRFLVADTITIDRASKTYSQVSVVRIDSSGMSRTTRLAVAATQYQRDSGSVTLSLPLVTLATGAKLFHYSTDYGYLAVFDAVLVRYLER